ncbi:MAG: MATE family efflux transporter [Gammaproteobacteria bacterium]
MSASPQGYHSGDPRLWHRRVWGLAGPIILSNLSIPLVGLVDTAVMGHLPDPVFIGAVALGAVIFSFIFWGFGFLRMGTTGLVAQARGRSDGGEIRATLGRGAVIALVCALAVLALQVPLVEVGLWFMDGGAELKALAREYFLVRIWATPATLLNYLILGALIGLQDTRSALVSQLVLNLANVVLDLWFVPGLGWGVSGVALASVISAWLAVGVGGWLLNRRLREFAGAWDRARILEPGAMKDFIAVNANILVRTLLLLSVFGYFTVLGTGMGPAVLAANAVLIQLMHVLAYGLDGFAHAAEALAGSAYGSRDRGAFRSAVRVSTLWALVVAALFALAYAVAGGSLVALITDIEAVRATADPYLPWLVLAPLVSVWSYQLDGIFIGTTRTVEMRNAMAVSTLFFVIASQLLIPLWGNHGLWLALLGFNAVRALTLWAYWGRIIGSLN